MKQTASSIHFFDRTLRMEFELTKAQQQTLELLTKNSLRAAEEIKVLKEVIEAQHNEIEELKKDLRIQQLTTAEKEYQDIVRVHNQERGREADWNYGAPKQEKEEIRKKKEEPYRQRIYDLKQQIDEIGFE